MFPLAQVFQSKTNWEENDAICFNESKTESSVKYYNKYTQFSFCTEDTFQRLPYT